MQKALYEFIYVCEFAYVGVLKAYLACCAIWHDLRRERNYVLVNMACVTMERIY